MTRRTRLQLTQEERDFLVSVTRSRTEQAGRVQRAQILLNSADHPRIGDLAKMFQTNRPRVERSIDRAMAYGVKQALNDLPRSGSPDQLTDEAKTWILSIAGQKPTELGYAHESWTYSLLLVHIRKECRAFHGDGLKRLGKGWLNAILSKGGIKPHKLSYYLEKRDKDFDQKMAQVLCVYQEVKWMNERNPDPREIVTISFDENPGIQVLQNLVPSLPPVPHKHPTTSRDHEYKRLGTVSLLVGID